MSPRRGALLLLALNGLLLLGIALRYDALSRSWEAWSVRRAALSVDGEQRPVGRP